MIDLSADLGEGSPGEDKIWPLITSANVACGGHTGDAHSMIDAARRAREFGVRLGAHPSYPDRENFGRKSMSLMPAELRASLVAQIKALQAIAPIAHVKAHGALYNDAHRDVLRAAVIAEALVEVGEDIAIVCPEGSAMSTAARTNGIRVIREAFADRRYNPDGSLVPRSEPDALLGVEEAAEQAALLASERAVVARDGSRLSVPHDTICIHADMAHAVERLRAIRKRIGGFE
jgi:5-oxoprolinase (ATP-hydrolysing) subunit A